MLRETMERFLEKTATTPELAKKLQTLERSYVDQSTTFLEEARVTLMTEDLCAETA